VLTKQRCVGVCIAGAMEGWREDRGIMPALIAMPYHASSAATSSRRPRIVWLTGQSLKRRYCEGPAWPCGSPKKR